jgi:hypothetical protein
MRREDRSSISFLILSQTSAGKGFRLFALMPERVRRVEGRNFRAD